MVRPPAVADLLRKIEPVELRRYDDGHVEIVKAPPLASFSLHVLDDAEWLGVDEAGYLDLAGQATYRPTSFVRELGGALALICERVR